MSDRKFHVTMEPNDSKPLPFYDRHFAPLLALAGVFIAAFFAMSDNVLNLFVNQPPEIQINFEPSDAQVEKGEQLLAWTILSDEDGSEKETEYKWELIGSKVALPNGVGEEFSRVELPTDKANKFTVHLTITDEGGEGKKYISHKQYIVTESETNEVRPTDENNTTTTEKIESISTDRIILSKDETIDWSKRRAKEIITNGHKLTINANEIKSDLIIASYLRGATSGRVGAPGRPGANGSFMQAGSNGLQGENGLAGDSGASASEIIININHILDSKLTIENSGQSGGSGGSGGRGGPGGSGGQGKPSKSGILDCSSGPGRGAQGGDGGNGGVGGNGGSAGDGGLVDISVGQLGGDGSLEIISRGGLVGNSGSGGAGGIPGAGGPEGRTGGFCSSAGRQGQSGSAGNPGVSGVQGGNGTDGNISVSIGSKLIKDSGSLVYPE